MKFNIIIASTFLIYFITNTFSYTQVFNETKTYSILPPNNSLKYDVYPSNYSWINQHRIKQLDSVQQQQSIINDFLFKFNSNNLNSLTSWLHHYNLYDKKIFRHINKIIHKYHLQQQPSFNHSYYSIYNISNINQLIFKLKELRGRRRRSFQNISNHHNHSNHSNVHTINYFNSSNDKHTFQSFLNHSINLYNITWPIKRIAEINGNVYIGGLMMIHERQDNITCGPIMPQGGIQALETMLYTVDQINKDEFLLPGVKIGVHILDDCDKDTYGLEQAVDFIKGSISNIDDDISACPDGSITSKQTKVIAGVVGAASSVTSIQVANLLRLFKIPQVSFFSTSPELSNKQRFEYFSRTIPSDKNQVQVMVEIIVKFKWRYISIIYEESNYGIKAFEEFERILPQHNVCIAVREKLVKDSGVAGLSTYEKIVEKLINSKEAKGVIIFGSDQEVKDLMRAVRKKNATGIFTWIGSDGWSARTLVSNGNEKEVEGTLSVQPKAKPVKGFDQYFFNLNLYNNRRNPWFVEFWEHHFKCKYQGSVMTPYNLNYNTTCSGEEKLSPENTPFEAQLQYVSDAVMAFAHALHDLLMDECKENVRPCSALNPVDGTMLLQYLKKVKFVGLSGDNFHFDSHQDGPARYNIIHFRKHPQSGTYHWTRVGEYNEGLLTLNMSAVQFADGSSNPPISVCSLPCLLGEAKRYFGNGNCCWNCVPCLNDQIRDPDDESICSTCPMGSLPNSIHTICDPIEEEYLKYSDGWAIGSMIFSGIGCILTTSVIIIFITHNDTPVVRAAGRELSYVILSGLFFCHALTFLFIIRPNDWICGIQQFLTGFIFTVVYAALLTKTNRIARIFQAGRRSARRPSFISPRSQLVICSLLVSIQVLINVVWMLLQPPKAIYHYPTRQDNFLVCEAYINHSYAVAFWYPLLIIFICTVYAVLTRKIPEAFNESKYIGFTMYTTCIIWLAFVPIYFSTATQVVLRMTSMTVAISLSAYVMLVCLFGPKLYIIIFHPERNVRQSMKPTAKHSTIASTTAASNTMIGTKVCGTMPANKNNHLDVSMARSFIKSNVVDTSVQCDKSEDGRKVDVEVQTDYLERPVTLELKRVDTSEEYFVEVHKSVNAEDDGDHEEGSLNVATDGSVQDSVDLMSSPEAYTIEKPCYSKESLEQATLMRPTLGDSLTREEKCETESGGLVTSKESEKDTVEITDSSSSTTVLNAIVFDGKTMKLRMDSNTKDVLL